MTPWPPTRHPGVPLVPRAPPVPRAPTRFNRLRAAWLIASLALANLLLPAGAAHAASPTELQTGYTAQAGGPASSTRGQQFFNARQGREWSCASCHGDGTAFG